MAISKNIIQRDKVVSIIVPCYNQAQYLDEALQSVLNQTYTNWECIIVNDGSPDNTEEVAKHWLDKDERFVYTYKKNGGLSSARNHGLKIAKGAFIQFLDCDDLIECQKIQKQIHYFEQHPDVYISIAGYRYFQETKEHLTILGRNNFLPEVVLFKDDLDVKELFDLKNPMVISSPIYRKEIFETVGYFDEELKALEDWDFNFRCALHDFTFEHLGYLKNTRTLIRLHDKSMMSDKHKINEQIIFFKKKMLDNQLYIDYFGLSKASVNQNQKSSSNFLSSIIKLLMPPIIIIVWRKI